MSSHSLIAMAKKVVEYCVEACRGSSLASHTAASLAVSAKKKAPEFAVELTEAARLLRLCESLARTATALLTSCSIRGDAASGASRGAPPSEPVARADATSAGTAQKKKKKRKNKNKDSDAPEVMPYNVVDAKMEIDSRPGPYFRPGAAAHECHAGTVSVAPSLGHVSFDGQSEGSHFSVGAQVFLTGLSSRADLVGKPAVVLSWNAASARYAVKLTASGESILVRPCNLQPSIFCNVIGNS